VTITSTFSRTNSAAISALRSGRPPSQRYSIAMVRPSARFRHPARRRRGGLAARGMGTTVQPNAALTGGVPSPEQPLSSVRPFYRHTKAARRMRKLGWIATVCKSTCFI
jgi:hypothetical protein